MNEKEKLIPLDAANEFLKMIPNDTASRKIVLAMMGVYEAGKEVAYAEMKATQKEAQEGGGGR